MSQKNIPHTPQKYAIRTFQLLQDYTDEQINLGTVLLLVKMLTKHPIENAVLFATGDAFKLGGLEFVNAKAAQSFLDSLSDNVRYAAFLKGKFHVMRYPYHSRSRGEWLFLPLIRENETSS